MSRLLDCPQVHKLRIGEVRNVSVDGTLALDDGESFTGGVTSDITPASGAPAVSGEAVSATALTILGKSVPAGDALICSLDASAASVGDYDLTLIGTTDAATAQTIRVKMAIEVIAA